MITMDMPHTTMTVAVYLDNTTSTAEPTVMGTDYYQDTYIITQVTAISEELLDYFKHCFSKSNFSKLAIFNIPRPGTRGVFTNSRQTKIVKLLRRCLHPV